MRRILTLTFVIAGMVALDARSAQAQAPLEGGGMPATTATTSAPEPAGRGLGLGATAMLSGLAGLSGVYDLGAFHIEGIMALGKTEGRRANFNLGGRFWFHLHTTSVSDFSVGGGLGFRHMGNVGVASDTNVLDVDGGAQLRAFIVPNVALSASLGLTIVVVDTTAFGLTGDMFGSGGSVGIHYYF